jgi:hypothetical protein
MADRPGGTEERDLSHDVGSCGVLLILDRKRRGARPTAQLLRDICSRTGGVSRTRQAPVRILLISDTQRCG